MSHTNVAGAAARASIAAGPLFLLLLAVFEYVQSAPEATAVSLNEVSALAYLPALLLPVTAVGAILAFPTCVVAGGALWFAGRFFVLVRSPPIWIAAGVSLALSILWLLNSLCEEPISYAFTGTALACAAIGRFSIDWE